MAKEQLFERYLWNTDFIIYFLDPKDNREFVERLKLKSESILSGPKMENLIKTINKYYPKGKMVVHPDGENVIVKDVFIHSTKRMAQIRYAD